MNGHNDPSALLAAVIVIFLRFLADLSELVANEPEGE